MNAVCFLEDVSLKNICVTSFFCRLGPTLSHLFSNSSRVKKQKNKRNVYCPPSLPHAHNQPATPPLPTSTSWPATPLVTFQPSNHASILQITADNCVYHWTLGRFVDLAVDRLEIRSWNEHNCIHRYGSESDPSFPVIDGRGGLCAVPSQHQGPCSSVAWLPWRYLRCLGRAVLH